MEHQQGFVAIAVVHVSIPERVWGGLEHGPYAIVEGLQAVSIPERVWGGLERILSGASRPPLTRFNP